MARPILAPLLAVVLLAGCTGDPARGTDPSSLAGGTGTSAPDPAALQEEGPVRDTVLFNGNIGMTFAAETPVGTVCIACGAPSPLDPGASDRYSAQRAGHDLLGGNLTVTWAAATPATQALVATVQACTGRDSFGDCRSVLAQASGPSPLQLAVPRKDLREGQRLSVLVRVASPLAPTLPGLEASVDQAFRLEGDLDYAP